MANAIYGEYKDALLNDDANIDIIAGDVKMILVDLADYTFSNAHDFLDDVPAGARVATSPNLTGKTVTGGVFDHDDVTFSSVSGDQAEALIYYIDTGVEGTSRLVAFLDTGQTGLPITPNGTDIDFVVNASGAWAL